MYIGRVIGPWRSLGDRRLAWFWEAFWEEEEGLIGWDVGLQTEARGMGKDEDEEEEEEEDVAWWFCELRS